VISLEAYSLPVAAYSPPNAKVQQRGRLQRLHGSESRNAGPVCCNGWFGGGSTSTQQPATEPDFPDSLAVAVELAGLPRRHARHSPQSQSNETPTKSKGAQNRCQKLSTRAGALVCQANTTGIRSPGSGRYHHFVVS
jgi:hypothetical protein